MIPLEELLGKTLLVGITDYDADGNAIDRTQFLGRAIGINAGGIQLELADGSVYWLPPDTQSTYPAPPGSYRLRSTGEIVENPDCLSTLNRTRED